MAELFSDRTQRRSLTLVGLAAFLQWSWLGTSTMDFRLETGGMGLRTGGWFMLGLPFMLVLGYLCTLPFNQLVRRGKQRIAWALLLLLSSLAIGSAYLSATPQARLRHALGVDIPKTLKLNALRVFDSMNEGETVYGQLDEVAVDFKDALVNHHALVEEQQTPSMLQELSDEALPEAGPYYVGARLAIYYELATGRLFFVRRETATRK